MKLYRTIEEIPDSSKGCVVALGNFDGFHRGHRVVVGEAGRLARQMGVPLAMVVTEPHPVSFFIPNKDPFRLTPYHERLKLLETFGVDLLLVLPFDNNLAGMSAQKFVMSVLVDGLNAKHVLVGYDYRFGKKRAGGTDVLSYMGAMEGFGLSVIDPVIVGIEGYAGEIYSSTLVRKALMAGEVRQAAALLGHWWTVGGKVMKGDQRGRVIGFPTANLNLGESQYPANGVYAVRVRLERSNRIYEGVANFGSRPTFDKLDYLLEVHLFNFKGNLYSQTINVEFVSFIRREMKFDGIDSLKKQIQHDCRVAKVILSTSENERDHLSLMTLDQYLTKFPDGFPDILQLKESL